MNADRARYDCHLACARSPARHPLLAIIVTAVYSLASSSPLLHHRPSLLHLPPAELDCASLALDTRLPLYLSLPPMQVGQGPRILPPCSLQGECTRDNRRTTAHARMLATPNRFGRMRIGCMAGALAAVYTGYRISATTTARCIARADVLSLAVHCSSLRTPARLARPLRV